METTIYNLNFYDALKECIENGKAIQGENFPKSKSVFKNKDGELKLFYNDSNDVFYFLITAEIYSQKFRVLNENEL